ncbi:MAG: response regulator [Betaproteobacteria bacterium]|nr:response regulator [Betaproteobacteria bacterium]
MALKNPFIVFEHDVYALTSVGEQELRGGETFLSPADIELLVRTDGVATVGAIAGGMQSLPAPAVLQAYARLARAGLVDLASNLREESLDFTDFFSDKPRPAPSDEELARARPEAAAGVSSLQAEGFFVRIARHGTARQRDGGSPPTAIVVEDDPHLGKFIKTYLAFEGFNVRLAVNRDEIIQALRESPAPDLVLLDVVLPDIDGFDVLLKMRQHPALKTVPVVMVTSKATRDAVLTGLARGADGYLTKPVEPESLLKAIRAVMGSDAGSQTSA